MIESPNSAILFPLLILFDIRRLRVEYRYLHLDVLLQSSLNKIRFYFYDLRNFTAILILLLKSFHIPIICTIGVGIATLSIRGKKKSNYFVKNRSLFKVRSGFYGVSRLFYHRLVDLYNFL